MKQSHECYYFLSVILLDQHMLVCGHTSQFMITIINTADELVMYACDCIAG